MIFRRMISSGWPFFSYIAMRNAGSITTIITIAAALTPMGFRSKKKSGAPMSAPQPKQMSCRFVRLNSTLLFTLVKSLGTLT